MNVKTAFSLVFSVAILLTPIISIAKLTSNYDQFKGESSLETDDVYGGFNSPIYIQGFVKTHKDKPWNPVIYFKNNLDRYSHYAWALNNEVIFLADGKPYNPAYVKCESWYSSRTEFCSSVWKVDDFKAISNATVLKVRVTPYDYVVTDKAKAQLKELDDYIEKHQYKVSEQVSEPSIEKSEQK